MGLLASLKILLYRYTGNKDIIVGTPLAGREHRDLQDQIGYYINTLALRTRFEEKDNFQQVFDVVRTTTMEAYEHQSYPFERLVEDLQLLKDPGRSMLFDIFVNLQNTTDDDLSRQAGEKDDLWQTDRDQILDLGPATCKFDLIFNFQEMGDDIYLAIEFNNDIHVKENIISLLQHYKQLLASILDNPLLPVNELSYLSVEEEGEIGRLSRGPEESYDSRPVTVVFSEGVQYWGKEVALRCGDKEWSYAELEARSNQVAHYLVKQGVGRDSLVGLYMNRSPEMVAGILGILKAGGAYVPIDPSYPSERVSHILSEIGGAVIISDSSSVLRLPEGLRVLVLEEAWAMLASQPSADLGLVPDEEQLAYVLYTSGSTGVPKGVEIAHRSLSHYMQWVLRTYIPEAESGNFGLYSSLSFDLTVTSLYGPLLKGKTLTIFPQDREIGDVLRDYLAEGSGLDILKLTPSHIQLIGALGIQRSSLRKVIVGGEQLHVQQVKILQRLNAAIEIYNEYGPTESTVGCSVSRIAGGVPEVIDIGRPVWNMAIYLLDSQQRLVGDGVTGELYIGGVQVGRGYWKRPELTAEKWIRNPYREGELLYRSGDLGRRGRDGRIEYLGRTDDQVKIRGYRVEPGEIESVLKAHESLKAAVVVVRTTASGEKELVGYVQGTGRGVGEELRNYLQSRLPEYMVPGTIVELEEMPLTSNGKIDRRMLQQGSGGGATGGLSGSYVAPDNEVEARLAAIWKEALGVQGEVGVMDSFFELGGHSIKAIKMLAQVSKEYGVVVSVKELFEEPFVQKMAKKILNIQWLKATMPANSHDQEYEKIEI